MHFTTTGFGGAETAKFQNARESDRQSDYGRQLRQCRFGKLIPMLQRRRPI